MTRTVICILCCTILASPAEAQMSAPPIPSVLPNVASMSAGNAAGVLQYCVKKNLVSSVSAGSVIDGLTKKPAVTKSKDYSAGQAGQILANKKFSIGAAPSYLQSQAFDMVLKRAKRF